MGISHDQYKEQVFAALTVGQFGTVYGQLEKAKPSGDGWMLACCPFHEDTNPSFGFNPTTGQWNCFSGCGKGDVWGYLMRQRDLPFNEVLVQVGQEMGIESPVKEKAAEQTYDYRDAQGNLLYQVVRRQGKKFVQRRPNDSGGWIWNLKGVDRVLYRLHELLAADPDVTVFIVEGEKDVERLTDLGLLATTNSGGAGKWRDSYAEPLCGRDIVIVPDNDTPGRDHGQRAAQSLKGKARSVKILELPDLPPKGDVSDWLDQGHSGEDLLALVEEAKPWQAENEPQTTIPTIQANGRQLTELTAETWEVLKAQNDPPKLFRSSGQLTRVEIDEDGPRTSFLDFDKAYGTLFRAARWVDIKGGHEVESKPPRAVANDILANPSPGLPYLEGVVSAPFFDPDWNLVCQSGYHRESKILLHLPADLEGLQVPDQPTDAEVTAALGLFLDDLLVDFPFAEQSDRTHAMAAFLLPFARRMFHGPTPLHLIEAPSPGSGKSILADQVSIVALGTNPSSMTLTSNEEETRKKITATLSTGVPVIHIDNVKTGIWSSQLASAITADIWKDRILGQTKIITCRNRALWIASANNPDLSLEIARRCVRIRIDPAEDPPWERQSFKHDPLGSWTLSHRVELVRAILTMIRSWMWAGAPHAQTVLGSFEAWSRIIGGILGHLGMTGFLTGTREFYEAADPETGEWRAFVEAWHQRHGGSPVGVAELLELAESNDLIAFACDGKNAQAQKSKLGKALNRIRGRKFGGVEVGIQPDGHTKARRYRLHDVGEDQMKIKEVV